MVHLDSNRAILFGVLFIFHTNSIETSKRTRSNTEQASRTNMSGQCEVLTKCERTFELSPNAERKRLVLPQGRRREQTKRLKIVRMCVGIGRSIEKRGGSSRHCSPLHAAFMRDICERTRAAHIGEMTDDGVSPMHSTDAHCRFPACRTLPAQCARRRFAIPVHDAMTLST